MPTPSASDPTQDAVSVEAAHWCMRVNEDDFTEQEREQLNQWLDIDPLHRREFDAMMKIWTVSEFLPATLPVDTVAQGKPQTVPRRGLRRPLMAAAVLLLALPIAGLAGWHLNVIPDSYQRFESSSTLRDIVLADGSRVQMNLGSKLSFANFKDRRSVNLSKGEAYFEVKHDASHPFHVDAGQGQVRVTGTKFNVWTYQDEVVVTLTQGSVQVIADRGRADQPAYLSPGMQAHYTPRMISPEVRAASPEEALAWRGGKLILRDLSLDDALPQINRYLPAPIHLGDRATGNLRIGGIYNTNDIAALVQTLPKVLPVYLSSNEKGETVVRNKRSSAP
jgi:transmembrane sensor